MSYAKRCNFMYSRDNMTIKYMILTEPSRRRGLDTNRKKG